MFYILIRTFLNEKADQPFLSMSVVLLTACSKQENAQQAEQNNDSSKVQKVVIASTGSDADIWRYIASLPETQAAGLKLEVKTSQTPFQ